MFIDPTVDVGDAAAATAGGRGFKSRITLLDENRCFLLTLFLSCSAI